MSLKGYSMQHKYRFSLFSKLFFYLSYFWYKLILPFEVKSPKMKLWRYEIAYSLMKFKDYRISIPWKHTLDVITTRFGEFRIRTNTSDAANVSPAFERRDLNFLYRLIRRKLSESKKVLFLDIGGDLGSYSVFALNRFKNTDLTVHCFEPVSESREMIEDNIRRNSGSAHFTLHPYALYNKNDDHAVIRVDMNTPGSSSIVMQTSEKVREIPIVSKRLDSIFTETVKGYDTVICKIDVEGVEQEVLEGMTGLLASIPELIVMVEDFVNPQIIEYLEKNKWHFMTKITTYNSWWKRVL